METNMQEVAKDGHIPQINYDLCVNSFIVVY